MPGAPLTVVQIGSLGDDGDGMYRVHEPGAALARQDGVEVYDVHYLSRWRDRAALAADVVVIYLTIDVELFRVIHQRRLLGRPTLCEINDYFPDAAPWNPVHSSWSDPRRQAYLYDLMQRCDAVQVSSAALAERFRGRNAEIHVFRNQVARMPEPVPDRDGATLTVGWGGSAGHLKDVEHVAPALLRWLDSCPAGRLAVMGDPRYAEVFAGAPAGRFRFETGGTLADYLRFVRTLDVGIAPLLPSDFNRCRSDVKYLEYASHGVVTVAQRLEPYLEDLRDGETGFLVDDSQGLVAVLDRLAADPALRRRVGRAARDQVEAGRLLERHVGARLELYRELVRRAGASRPDPSGAGSGSTGGRADIADPGGRSLRTLPGLVPCGVRFWRLDPRSPAEQRFLEGLTALEAQAVDPQASDRALAAFGEATRLAPDYAQAFYYAGRCLLRRGSRAEAERAFSTAARIDPSYSRPLSALAELYGAAAEDFRRRSAELNPPRR